MGYEHTLVNGHPLNLGSEGQHVVYRQMTDRDYVEEL